MPRCAPPRRHGIGRREMGVVVGAVAQPLREHHPARRELGGDMVGIIGIFVSLALLIYLAQRGWNVIFVAPICATVAILFNWGDLPVLASYTQIFMPALGSYFATYFPLFLLGAVFGKLMDDSGSARAIAHSIVNWVGGARAILAVVLACALLTYGGVSLFVVAFS